MMPKGHPGDSPDVGGTRRAFLIKCGVLAAGSAALPGALLAATPGGARPERDVRNFVGQYGERMRVAGAAVLAKCRGRATDLTQLIVQVSDLSGMQQAWLGDGQPFAEVFSRENALLFTHGGMDFSVENLLPAAFQQRLEDMALGKGANFAHDAMSSNPATGSLHDPLGAGQSGELVLVNRGDSLAAALEVVLRGWTDAHALGLQTGTAFDTFAARVLAGSGGSRTSRKVAGSIVEHIPSLPPARVPELLRSRLADSSLRSAFGVSGPEAVRRFKAARSALGAGTDGAPVWLSAILAGEFASGITTTMPQPTSRFSARRIRAALAEARQVAQSPAFQQIVPA